MTNNINELRKEAYRLWGINQHRVIYNIDSIKFSNIIFKLDFSESNVSWPRAYTLAFPNSEPMLRVIVPIIKIEQYNKMTVERKLWFDMSFSIHEKLITLVNDSKIERPLKWWQNTVNYVLPDNMRYNSNTKQEDYKYMLIKHDSEYIINVF